MGLVNLFAERFHESSLDSESPNRYYAVQKFREPGAIEHHSPSHIEASQLTRQGIWTDDTVSFVDLSRTAHSQSLRAAANFSRLGAGRTVREFGAILG